MLTIDLALVICNEGANREKIVESVVRCGLSPICCANLEEARTLLPQDEFRMVLCSEALRDGDFRSVLREARKLGSETPVIVFGRSYDWDSYLKAIGAGAYDYIVCPLNPMEMQRIISSALANGTGAEYASGAMS